MESNAGHPSRQVLIKFLLLCLLLSGYFGYLSWEFDVLTGGVASLITWSFFVLCTPVADAGFVLDFPLRLLFGIRMVVSEVAVWVIALSINALSLAFAAGYYDTTVLTRILHKIILTPYPYWGVVLLSGVGTFLSIRFGDELMDVIHHRDRSYFHRHGLKFELVLVAFFVMAIWVYYELIRSLDIPITG